MVRSLTPDIYRYENLWNTDLRFSKRFTMARGTNFQLIADLFNVFNANTELVRNRNAAPTAADPTRPGPTYRTLSQNLSPRIWRLGVRVGF